MAANPSSSFTSTGYPPLDSLFEQTRQMWTPLLAHPKLPSPPIKTVSLYCLVWPKDVRVELDVDPFGKPRYKVEDKKETQLALLTRDVDLAVARLAKLSQ